MNDFEFYLAERANDFGYNRQKSENITYQYSRCSYICSEMVTNFGYTLQLLLIILGTPILFLPLDLNHNYLNCVPLLRYEGFCIYNPI